MKIHNRLPHNQSGLSVIELMIAILVSLFLIGGVIQLYISNKMTYRTMSGVARLQNNARHTINLLSHEIRMSNYGGCRSLSSDGYAIHNYLNPYSSELATDSLLQMLTADAPFFALEHNGSNWVPSALADSDLINALTDLDTGSDILVSRRMSSPVAKLKDDIVANGAANFKIHEFIGGDTRPIKKGTIYAINDCSSNIAIFQDASATPVTGSSQITCTISSTGLTPGNKFNKFQENYPAGSEMGFFETTVFYIKNVSGVRTLMRAGLVYDYSVNPAVPSLAAEELVRGIESLQFLFGVDSDDDGVVESYAPASYYDDSTAAKEWANVQAVRLTFTASTVDVIDHDITYSDSSLDGKIVRRFSSVIDMRNPPKY